MLHKVESLYVFGSAAKNEMHEKSDIDLIVRFKKDIPVEDWADLYFELAESLEGLFKKQVDLLTDKPIRNKFLREELDETKTLIYHAA